MEEYNSLTGDLFGYFLNPARKTYWLHALSSVIIAICFGLYFSVRHKKSDAFQKLIFNRKHWIGPSPFLDYFLLFINAVIRVFLIVPFLLTAYELSFSVSKFLMLHFDLSQTYHGPKWPVILSYTLCLWLFGDFSRFLLHYLTHRIKFLWEFHKVHHSATVMNPFTLYRQHPLEMLLFHLRGTLVFGIVTGFFYYRFSSALTLFEILGVNIGRFIFLFLGANLRHSHIPLRYGNFLEHIFISPLQHQIHHSKDKNDHHKNMGSHLAIWDWMFGTLKISNADTKVIEFGLPEQGYEINNWWNALWSPLVNAFKSRKN